MLASMKRIKALLQEKQNGSFCCPSLSLINYVFPSCDQTIPYKESLSALTGPETEGKGRPVFERGKENGIECAIYSEEIGLLVTDSSYLK